MEVLLLVISLFASTIGAITGIGGGVIIKPVVDILNIIPVSVASFLSGCTVLSMAIVSLIRSKKNNIKVDLKYSTYLAISSILGGVIGKSLFDAIKNVYETDSILIFLQSTILLLLTVFVLIYMINKNKIKTYNIKNKLVICFVGLILGMTSAFLGIGGGPINLVVLYLLFSMDSKTAAVNSIYIIFFSQISNLLFSIFSKTIPPFETLSLVVMIIGGVVGGLVGSEMLKRISKNGINKVFNILLLIIIFICGINAYRAII